jgi:hypothetical protein
MRNQQKFGNKYSVYEEGSVRIIENKSLFTILKEKKTTTNLYLCAFEQIIKGHLDAPKRST